MSLSFAELGVPEHFVARLKSRGIETAFPIQEVCIPDALQGIDVVGKAATGSGKTLAFGLPLLARTEPARPRKPHALILVPTRELAAQVQKELAQLTEDKGRRILAIYGGTSYHTARKALAAGVDVIVACPGRLEDMLDQGAFDLRECTTVAIDEADRMADMGFMPAVRRIMRATAETRHVMLFSATMGPDVRSLVKEFTKDAITHDVVGEEAPSDVDHFFWRVPRDQKPNFCAEVIEEHGQAIVFTRTKHGADRLAKQLGERGLSAVPLHGDRSQAQRERALRSVKSGQIQVLVATDVAARGIHIDDLPVVIHYDPPSQATDYLHRSGRTGRAGASGVVISLVGDDVIGQVKRMMKALGLNPNIEPREDAVAIRLGAVDDAEAAERTDDRGPAPRKGADRFVRGEGREKKHSFGRHREEGEDRPFRRDRDDRPARAPREDRGFAPRGERSERPAFRDRDERPARAPREDRGFAPRGERSERPAFRDRDERPARAPREDRGFAARGDSKPGKAGEAVVAFFNESKGFGFASDSKGDDLFIHFSSIQGDGFKTLTQGQRITFEEATGPKGREARNVRAVGGGERGDRRGGASRDGGRREFSRGEGRREESRGGSGRRERRY